MDPILRDIITEAFRVIFLLGLPVVLLAALAGSIVGALQSATSIQDTTLQYATRLIVVMLVLYFLTPAIGRYFVQLAERAFGAV
ncbi:MAG: flagellar biosynthetic protein FliQ [Bdellovibrionales bacterium]|nr:flagellar biosynthetic protein FliQ [Bdellovibrionales bacterium]